ncbi:MAG: tRNA (adenosine(37)-N6)-dimethylallyltransferase MiaA, partial [Prevotella sp.]|nr:tRNA (adenosine(37)-N6)-dimethylallyltransferase MiaA [Prevotella sp.]
QLIDNCPSGEKYNLFRHREDFEKALRDIRRRDKQPILCGGTGLYVEGVVRNYSLPHVPENPALRASLESKALAELATILADLKRRNGTTMHNTTDTNNARRTIRAIEIETYIAERGISLSEGRRGNTSSDNRCRLVFGVDISRERRRERITRRLKERLDGGMIEEIRRLLDSGIAPDDLIYYGLEYKYVTEYCVGRRTYDDMFHNLETAIHQFAKRQMTWFRGMERRGINIHWIDYDLTAQEKISLILSSANRSGTK